MNFFAPRPHLVVPLGIVQFMDDDTDNNYRVTLRFQDRNGLDITTEAEYARTPEQPPWGIQNDLSSYHLFILHEGEDRTRDVHPPPPSFRMSISRPGSPFVAGTVETIFLDTDGGAWTRGTLATLVGLERLTNEEHAHRLNPPKNARKGDDFGSIQYWKRKAATKKNWNSKVVDRFYGLYSNAR